MSPRWMGRFAAPALHERREMPSYQERETIAAALHTMTKEVPKTGTANQPAIKPKAEPVPRSSRNEIDAFLAQAKSVTPTAGRRGRLIFALDATMSRQPTWDSAVQIQAEMFQEAGKVGGLDVQLLYYRGFGECRASKWVNDTRALADLMTGIDVRGGRTQIGKVLTHARKESKRQRVQAMVFVGDAMEEDVDAVCAKAGELGLLGVPVFIFQEGRDPHVEKAFREIARLTKGAFARFDQNAVSELAALLRAVAAYAAGGHKALSDHGRRGQLLLEQLR